MTPVDFENRRKFLGLYGHLLAALKTGQSPQMTRKAMSPAYCADEYRKLYDKLYFAAFVLTPELFDVFNETDEADIPNSVAAFKFKTMAITEFVNNPATEEYSQTINTLLPSFARHAYEGYLQQAERAGDSAEGMLGPLFNALLKDTTYPDASFASFVAIPLVRWPMGQKNGGLLTEARNPQDVDLLVQAIDKRPEAFKGQDVHREVQLLLPFLSEEGPIYQACKRQNLLPQPISARKSSRPSATL